MKKILVIEDEITIRNNLLELLDAEHYWVLGAENGQQGLDLAREYLPDLVFSQRSYAKLTSGKLAPSSDGLWPL